MKIKPAEIVMGIMLVSMGVMGMGEKELFHYDVPIPRPEVFSVACLVAGIVWLVVPWFLRSRKKQ
ncbi:hypothetical protein SAMN02745704_02933 [Paucidesulfovibrio gracilis DSM 16080]|uniref:Uncharacterized protein n=1 Tax=Paucidesulfovibrio gracilis DSM 16080 TaxID=1121449 RepID=A0A1T4Y9S7_9BACT|nr:hypothetical protein [Paucidesulfovibrio gracilis]SKA98562.1 hypothetical protein SAMN02745704_02933 [Paucidesulfovibrio gracilis DSM 16080]